MILDLLLPADTKTHSDKNCWHSSPFPSYALSRKCTSIAACPPLPCDCTRTSAQGSRETCSMAMDFPANHICSGHGHCCKMAFPMAMLQMALLELAMGASVPFPCELRIIPEPTLGSQSRLKRSAYADVCLRHMLTTCLVARDGSMMIS